MLNCELGNDCFYHHHGTVYKRALSGYLVLTTNIHFDSGGRELTLTTLGTRNGYKKKKGEQMPIEIHSEPICIATICIFGCAFVGYLAAHAGCQKPLVVLFAVLIVGIILFKSIHAIARLADNRGEAAIIRFPAHSRQ